MAYQKMAVVFIDILGTKNVTKFNEKYSIHKIFHDEIKLNENRQLSKKQVVYDRKLFSFSDCAYIFYFYKEGTPKEKQDDVELAYVAIQNTCISFLKFISHGFLVRGGMCFDKAYIDDMGFFGPAIKKAYKIESKEAIYPRLMLDKNIGKQLYDTEQNRAPEDQAPKEIFSSSPYLIEKDETSYFANLFFHLEQSTYVELEKGTRLTLQDVKDSAQKIIARDKKKFAENEKICTKLEWFEKYISRKECLLKSVLAANGGVQNK